MDVPILLVLRYKKWKRLKNGFDLINSHVGAATINAIIYTVGKKINQSKDDSVEENEVSNCVNEIATETDSERTVSETGKQLKWNRSDTRSIS